MAFEDRTLECVACGAEFMFSSGEQEFFQERGTPGAPLAKCLPRFSGRLLPGDGQLDVEIISPWPFSFVRAPGGPFPLGLGRQLLAGPVAVSFRFEPGDSSDR